MMYGLDRRLYLTNLEVKRITLPGAGKVRDDLAHDVSPAVWQQTGRWWPLGMTFPWSLRPAADLGAVRESLPPQQTAPGWHVLQALEALAWVLRASIR